MFVGRLRLNAPLTSERTRLCVRVCVFVLFVSLSGFFLKQQISIAHAKGKIQQIKRNVPISSSFPTFSSSSLSSSQLS